ncbi:zinc-ribbon domain-containing protein [bacterium]|nr:zinc-ribbon domain-containing protein [bacterium]
MKCTSCGASLPENASTCEYCGTKAPAPENNDDKIFDLIKQSPQYASQMVQAQSARMRPKGPMPFIAMGLFFFVWCGVGLFITTMFFSHVGMLGILPLGMVLFGVVAMLSTLGKALGSGGGPMKVIPAIVLRKKGSAVPPGGFGESFGVIFKFESGRSEEFFVADGLLYERLSEQDAGILSVRDNQVVKFDEVLV